MTLRLQFKSHLKISTRKRHLLRKSGVLVPTAIFIACAWSAASPNVCLAQAAEIATPLVSEQVQVNETITEGFKHPGLGMTRAILENARRQAMAKQEPWYSGFEALAASPFSSKTVTCRNQSAKDPSKPDDDAFNSKSTEGRLKQDGAKAKQQALMYFFTGEEVYRANAMNIVRVWSQMDPAKYKMYSEAYIHASYPIQDLITAAELLRYTSTSNPKLAWNDTDTRDFTNNFAVPAVRTFLDGNGWFMNQNGYPIAAAMSGDIFTNDRASYARRVEWFTVNKDAPNKGWSSSVQDLARRVDTNALTGQKVDRPVIQLMEMGRDQAHAGDDVEIYNNTARMLSAQGTKVDPVMGTVSTAANAVGPYEFLDDRILAAADQFCRFMLGYDTPWIPAAYNIGPDGEIRGIYPRIADNYRGRIRGFDFWDIYYYYANKKGVDVAQKAPYYHEAFTKRIVSSVTDWIYIPAGVTGEGAKVPPRVQEPPVVQVELRSTQFNDQASVMSEGDTSFVRLTPTAEGTRIAMLSCDTDKKTIGMRIRTTGATEAKMSGLERPWLLPDTGGQWRTVTYTMGDMERFKDIEYFSVQGNPNTKVDIDCLYRDAEDKLKPLTLTTGNQMKNERKMVTYVGAPVHLDFTVANAGSRAVTVDSLDKPQGAKLDAQAGKFSWTPSRAGNYAFIVNATDGETIEGKKVQIQVAPNRETAVRQVVAAYKDVPYVSNTSQKWQAALSDIRKAGKTTSNEVFSTKLIQLQDALNALQPLTPRLADGSMDYPGLVETSDIGPSIKLLADDNDDTFPGYFLVKDFNYIFDFGPKYRISASAFALEGRLNFEDRTQETAFFGSNDGNEWMQLTLPIKSPPSEMTKIEVIPEQSGKQFRYLKVQKTKPSGLFEPAELRIYGERIEVQ